MVCVTVDIRRGSSVLHENTKFPGDTFLASPRYGKNIKTTATVIPCYSTHHYSGTSPDFTFIFKELPSLMFFKVMCVYGLGSENKSILTLSYTGLVTFHCILRLLVYRYHKFCILYKRKGTRRFTLLSVRGRRRYLAAFRHRLLVCAFIAVAILLLLSGDVHPNPGPVLPGSRRHPLRQMLSS